MARTDEERRALRRTEEFGVVDPDVARRAARRRSMRDRSTRVQPESSTPGRSNPPVDPGVDPSTETLESRNRAIDRSIDAAHRRGFRQTREFDDGGTAEISFPRQTLLDRGFSNPGQETPNVTTIPAESFVNPAFTGIRSGENIARAVRQDFERDQRQAEIDSDMEFRRNLRQRNLLDDANLRLSGDMTLTELADAASRRRSARTALREQDITDAELQASRAEQIQERDLEVMKERGRNLRKRLDPARAREERQRESEAYDRGIKRVERRTSFTDEEGKVVKNPGAVQKFEDFVSAEGLNVADMTPAQQNVLADFSFIADVIGRETDPSISLESPSEVMAVIGSINQDIWPFSDDLEILDDEGKVRTSVALEELEGNPSAMRTIRTVIRDKVREGELTNEEIWPWLFSFFQRPDEEFGQGRTSLRDRG